MNVLWGWRTTPLTCGRRGARTVVHLPSDIRFKFIKLIEIPRDKRRRRNTGLQAADIHPAVFFHTTHHDLKSSVWRRLYFISKTGTSAGVGTCPCFTWKSVRSWNVPELIMSVPRYCV